jgi:1,4-dihydroxy-2-naphthoyl-CoA hydrolase
MPNIDFTRFDLDTINRWGQHTLAAHLGIEFVETGVDFLRARMPVDQRTVQPFGLLHGGASVALAETLGSVASVCCIDLQTQSAVGLEINANHLRGVNAGYVYGTVRPIHVGRTHIWDIRIVDETDGLVCVSRITLLILNKPAAAAGAETSRRV